MDTDAPARRMRVALDLLAAAEAMVRQRLRRDHPGITAAELDEAVREWRIRRPGGEHGDATGRSANRFA